jgi:Tol biopolymer transport system component
MTVDAFTQPNAGGAKVATASIAIDVVENQTTTKNVSANLVTTIDDLIIQSQPISVQAGNQRQLTARAEDVSNNVILLPPGALTWSVVSGGTFGSISPSGNFTATAQGVTRVRVAETAAGKLAEADVTVTPPPPPPQQYKLAFTSDRDDIGAIGVNAIYTIISDGSAATRITFDEAKYLRPRFNPAGTKIVVASDRDSGFTNDIYSMNADGSGIARLTESEANEVDPSWSADGSKIVFSKNLGTEWHLMVMSADGSGVTQITAGPGSRTRPCWNAAGTKIVFEFESNGDSEICTINPDGTGFAQLTNNSSDDFAPAFSPDGAKIVFVSFRVTEGDVYTMNANGSSQTRLAALSGTEDDPVYSPDGLKVFFSRDPVLGGINDVFMVNAVGGGSPLNVTVHPSDDLSPSPILWP